MLTKTLSEAKKKQRSILIKAMNNDIGSIDSAKDSWNPAQISERAKDISYIRSLVDTWNPAQLNEALRMLDLPIIDTWNPAQIEEQRRNLVFYLAERTLTGNPITLNILGNLTSEVTGLKVTMNPIQDLHGYDNPWAGGAGKNKLNPSLVLDQSSWNQFTLTLKPNTQYTASANIPNDGVLLFYFSDTTSYGTSKQVYSGNSITITSNSSGVVYIQQRRTADSASFASYNIMIAEGTDTTFAPYSNICPISGRTEVGVTRTGKNILDYETAMPACGFVKQNDEWYASRSSVVLNKVLWENIAGISGSITVSYNYKFNSATYAGARLKFIYSDGTQKDNPANPSEMYVHIDITSDANKTLSRIDWTYGTGSVSSWIKDIQIELGSTATAYEPYQAETHTHQYSETIYGGTDDFVNGGATISDAKFDVNGTETGWSADIPYSTQPYNRFVCTGIPSLGVTSNTEFEGISNLFTHTKLSQGINNGFRLRYVNGTNRLDIFTDAFDSLSELQAYLSSEPLQICYELATPTTISTSAEEITLLKGTNVLSTDGDSIELKYKQNF